MFRVIVMLFVVVAIVAIALVIYSRPLLSIVQHCSGVRFYFEPRSNEKVIYLTIDDSPTINTNDILSVLEKYQVKASFFVISKSFPSAIFNETIRAISQAGHDVCNHTATEKASIRLDKSELKQSILHCSNAIESITSKRPAYFRPGSGFFNSYILEEAQKENMAVVLGDVYPHDAHISNVFFNALYVSTFVQNGSIIILHDRPWTMDVLNLLVPNLLARGFEFRRLSDFIQ